MAKCMILLTTRQSGEGVTQSLLNQVRTLGRFGEHFAAFSDRRSDPARRSPAQFHAAIEQGRGPAGDVGFTLVAEDLDGFAAGYLQEPIARNRDAQIRQGVRALRMLAAPYDQLQILLLRRNFAEQAIARCHRRAMAAFPGVPDRTAFATLSPGDFIREAHGIAARTQVLVDIIAEGALPFVKVHLHDILDRPGLLTDTARDCGFDLPENDDPVLPEDIPRPVAPRAAAAQRLAESLGLGAWQPETLETAMLRTPPPRARRGVSARRTAQGALQAFLHDTAR